MKLTNDEQQLIRVCKTLIENTDENSLSATLILKLLAEIKRLEAEVKRKEHITIYGGDV